jgi:hypothetical protein
MKITNREDVKFKKKVRGPRGTKYEDTLKALRKLKKSEALILTPDKGMTVQSLKTRIWSAMYRAGMLDPEAKRYYATRTTEEGGLAVMVKMK